MSRSRASVCCLTLLSTKLKPPVEGHPIKKPVEGHEESNILGRLNVSPFELAPIGGRVVRQVLRLEHLLLHHAEDEAGGNDVGNVGNEEAGQEDGKLDEEKERDLENLTPSHHHLKFKLLTDFEKPAWKWRERANDGHLPCIVREILFCYGGD